MQLCLNVLQCLFYCFINWNNFLKEFWREKVITNIEKDDKRNNIFVVEKLSKKIYIEGVNTIVSKKDTRLLLNFLGPYDKIWNMMGKGSRRNLVHLFTKIEYYWQCFRFLIYQEEILLFMFFIGCSIFGLIYDAAFIYCFHCFDIVVSSLKFTWLCIY